MVIAIDGPAGSGKSTVAARVAAELGLPVLDSGAMYRCVALLWLSRPQRSPAELARAARMQLGERVLLDGRDVTAQIRAPEVSQAASRLASDPEVRDIGSVVAPQAELKIFLTAAPDERARRRARQLGAEPAAVLAEQARRDARDSERAHSPLRPAADAITLDTTRLSAEQVVEQ